MMGDYDDWDYEPSDDNKPSILEALETTALFFGKIIVVLVIIGVIIGAIAYSIWREIAIFHLLAGA